VIQQYAAIRAELKRYGIEKFETEMTSAGVFGNGKILPSSKPFNAFARILSGDLIPAYPLDLLERRGLEKYTSEFLLAKNKPELDEAWKNPVEEGKPMASMSLHHEFLIPRDPNWKLFNVLTIGIDCSIDELEKFIILLERMREVSLASARYEGWSENIGLFFHCFPLNSIHTLHMHIVDLDNLGPSFHSQQNKNLPLDDILTQLRAELEESKIKLASKI